MNRRIYSCVNGKLDPLSAAMDPSVASKSFGEGWCLMSDDGMIYSPINGEVIMLFPSFHAIGLRTEAGDELLIHIGVDLERFGGQGMRAWVQVGSKVVVHQKLIQMDLPVLQSLSSSLQVFLLITKSKHAVLLEDSPRDIRETDQIGEFYIEAL